MASSGSSPATTRRPCQRNSACASTRAIVRLPGRSYAQGLTTSAALGRPDLERALQQHAAYCEALRECGLELTVLEPDERYPDGTFVEDTAVVAARVAVTSRPGAPTRAGEVPSVAAALARFRPELESIVGARHSRWGRRVPGRGSLSDRRFGAHQRGRRPAIGRRSWRVTATRASLVDIRAHRTLLHLKSGIAYLGERRFTVSADAPHLEVFRATSGSRSMQDESYAANCVRVNDIVLLAAGYPRAGGTTGGPGLCRSHPRGVGIPEDGRWPELPVDTLLASQVACRRMAYVRGADSAFLYDDRHGSA